MQQNSFMKRCETKGKNKLKSMNNYIKTGICSLLLGLSGGIAWQFGFVPIGFVLIFFMVLALVCGPDVFE